MSCKASISSNRPTSRSMHREYEHLSKYMNPPISYTFSASRGCTYLCRSGWSSCFRSILLRNPCPRHSRPPLLDRVVRFATLRKREKIQLGHKRASTRRVHLLKIKGDLLKIRNGLRNTSNKKQSKAGLSTYIVLGPTISHSRYEAVRSDSTPNTLYGSYPQTRSVLLTTRRDTKHELYV